MPSEPESEVAGLTADLAQRVVALVYNGSTYPTRPAGAAVAIFVGTADPAGAASNNDIWVNTT